MNRMTPPDRRAPVSADRGTDDRYAGVSPDERYRRTADPRRRASADARQTGAAAARARSVAAPDQRSAGYPTNAAGADVRKGRQSRRPGDQRVSEIERQHARYRHERRQRDVKRARIELVLIGVAAVVVIVIFALLVSLLVRSLRSGGAAQTEDAVMQGESDAAAAKDSPVVTEAEGTADAEDEAEPVYPVNYAVRTANTRLLTDAEIYSPHAIMIDLATNTVIMDRDGDARIYPASMTKMMTLIVAYENAKDLEDTFTMTEEIVGKMWQEGATVAGFGVDEKVRIDDLMYGLILPSGGDCAMALAIYTAGSEEAFADLMNKKVAELGLKGTHFANASGLHDPDQYSTCHDMALILEYALQNEFMKTVLSTYEYTTHPTEQHPDGIPLSSTTQERVSGDEAPGMYICGGKTGYTNEAKNCLATYAVRYDSAVDDDASAKKKAPEYIFVTAEADGKYSPIFDAINAYALILDENAMETRYR